MIAVVGVAGAVLAGFRGFVGAGLVLVVWPAAATASRSKIKEELRSIKRLL